MTHSFLKNFIYSVFLFYLRNENSKPHLSLLGKVEKPLKSIVSAEA